MEVATSAVGRHQSNIRGEWHKLGASVAEEPLDDEIGGRTHREVDQPAASEGLERRVDELSAKLDNGERIAPDAARSAQKRAHVIG